MPYYVRRMHREDIPQVTEIDREAFPTEWPPPNFKHELQNRVAYYIVACDAAKERDSREKQVPERGCFSGLLSRLRGLFSEKGFRGNEPTTPDEQYIVGFAGFWIMADEAHITSIAARKSHRQQGIGELLLTAVAEMAVRLKARTITLEVRISNRAAQSLYAKYGFTEVGVRRGYYLDNREDAILMSTEDINSAAFQRRLRQLKQAHSAKWGTTDYRVQQ